MSRPLGPTGVIRFVVDADQEARAATEAALARRFGMDHRVVTAATPESGLAALERLADHGGEVALIAADLGLPGMDGVEFLERAHGLHRNASGVLLITMDRHHTRIPLTN